MIDLTEDEQDARLERKFVDQPLRSLIVVGFFFEQVDASRHVVISE